MFLVVVWVCLLGSVAELGAQIPEPPEVMYTFTSLDYDWAFSMSRSTMVNNGDFIVENNIITGIKVYKDSVYVTVPRWRPGVPATLNKILSKDENTTVLKPYPGWYMNTIGNCEALQYVQSMEIDPNTGYMWIIDTGRINTNAAPDRPRNLCLPKLVIYDIEKDITVRKYVFPADVVDPKTNFMNDIVLDYVDGEAKYAYITDTSDAKLYAYDYVRNESYFFQHETMKMQRLDPNRQIGLIAAPIDGIAMSPDFKYLFYSTLSSTDLYAVLTKTMRNKRANFAKEVYSVGKKWGGSDGMTCGQKSLFYGALEDNAIVKSVGMLSNQQQIVKDDKYAAWVDTLAWNGTYLWYTANRMQDYFWGRMNFSGNDVNMVIAKINVGERGYLDGAKHLTTSSAISLTLYFYVLTIALFHMAVFKIFL